MSGKHVHPAALFAHQPATPGGSSHQAAQTGWEIRDILVRQSHREPRSVQRAPGPSELGMVCLQGETEVVTRQGIREIRDLAKEGSAELLIPMLYEGSDVRKKWGRFTEVPVESFGEQELYEITLHRGQDSKTVFATADHHWFRSYWSGKQRAQKRLATTDLRPGYRLTQLRRAMPRSTTMMPVAVAQGFTFGDGAKGSDDDKHRPAILDLFHNGKAEALLPFFPGEHKVYRKADSVYAYSRVRGLPRFWKQLPSVDESVSFLMSWLAGYFAADGSVTEDGHCKIDSAYRENLEFVRDAAAVCGIGYGQIQTIMRRGACGTENGKVRLTEHETPLYRLSLRRRDLPDWFFLIEKHARRIRAVSRAPELDPHWIVESVRATGRTELVYCAITGDAGAFALADDLMTGNCDRAVVSKMAGEAETGHTGDPWPSIVGLALDAWIKRYFANENRLNGYDRWLTDVRVYPHPLYPGTLDLYDTVTYTVIDLKALGVSTAAKLARSGPSPRYKNQVLLYAWGMRLAGYRVDRVAIVSLPRTKSFLADIYVWDHVLTEEDDLAVIELLQRTEARRRAAQMVLSQQLPIEAVQRTPDGESCHFCGFFRIEAAHDGGPGCPGDRAPVTYPARGAPAA